MMNMENHNFRIFELIWELVNEERVLVLVENYSYGNYIATSKTGSIKYDFQRPKYISLKDINTYEVTYGMGKTSVMAFTKDFDIDKEKIKEIFIDYYLMKANTDVKIAKERVEIAKGRLKYWENFKKQQNEIKRRN